MAVEIRSFAVTVPAGTLEAAPQTTDISFPPRVVEQVRVRIPPGPRGVLGFQLTTDGVPVIPLAGEGYIVADDETFVWDLTDFLDSGAWELTAYNVGQYDHTVYLIFELDLIGAAELAATSPIGAGQLAGALGPGGVLTLPPVTLPTLPAPAPVTLPTLPAPPQITPPAVPAPPTLPAPAVAPPPTPYLPPALVKHLCVLVDYPV